MFTWLTCMPSRDNRHFILSYILDLLVNCCLDNFRKFLFLGTSFDLNQNRLALSFLKNFLFIKALLFIIHRPFWFIIPRSWGDQSCFVHVYDLISVPITYNCAMHLFDLTDYPSNNAMMDLLQNRVSIPRSRAKELYG